MTEQHNPSTTRRRLGRIAVPATAALAGMLFGAGVVALVGNPTAGDPFTLVGEVDVKQARTSGEFCPDLADDKIHVLSETGVIIAVGRLKKPPASTRGTTCTYRFTVDAVPGGHAAYGVVMPGMNEPPRIYSAKVLREQTPLELTDTFRVGLAEPVRS